LLFGIGTALTRSAKRAEAVAAPPDATPQPRQHSTRDAVTWPLDVDASLVDLDETARLEMIERLALVDTQWSVAILRAAATQERAPAIRTALERALANRSS
jgi:hypothetical protein